MAWENHLNLLFSEWEVLWSFEEELECDSSASDQAQKEKTEQRDNGIILNLKKEKKNGLGVSSLRSRGEKDELSYKQE